MTLVSYRLNGRGLSCRCPQERIWHRRRDFFDAPACPGDRSQRSGGFDRAHDAFYGCHGRLSILAPMECQRRSLPGAALLIGAMAGVFLLNWFTPDMARRAIGFIGLVYVGTELLKIGIAHFACLPRSDEKYSHRSGRGSCLGTFKFRGGLSLHLYRRTSQERVFCGNPCRRLLRTEYDQGRNVYRIRVAHLEIVADRIGPRSSPLAGGWVGKGLNRRIPEKDFKRWIFVLIIGACIKLIFF